MSYNPLRVSLDNIIPLTEARDHFSQIVNEVQKDNLYVLTKGGKPAVAIVDVKYLEQITGGNVNPSHVEQEIQKNPAKVGRPEMISHSTAPAPQAQIQTPPPAKPAITHLEENKPAAPSPKPFQPQTNSGWSSKPTAPPAAEKPVQPSTPAPAKPVLNAETSSASQNVPLAPANATPQSTFTPPTPKPLDTPAPTLMTPSTTPTPAQPTSTSSWAKPQTSTTPPTFTPAASQTPSTPAPIKPNPTASIDVQPIADADDAASQSASQSDNSRVSPDDQAGPAQYKPATTGSNDPDDMQID